MGKKKKKLIQEQTSQIVASKAGKLLSKKFTKDLDGYLTKLMKVENKLGKVYNNFETDVEKFENSFGELKEYYGNLLDDFQDFILTKKEEIRSVAASALTQSSGEVAEDDAGNVESTTRGSGKAKI